MPLTKAQKKKVEAIKQIAKLGGVDFWNVENEPDNDVKNVLLDVCNDRNDVNAIRTQNVVARCTAVKRRLPKLHTRVRYSEHPGATS